MRSRAAQRSLKVDGGDRHGLAGALRGGLGHDSEADARFHHAADGIEASELHSQAQRFADAARLVGEEALQGARAVEADEIVVEDVGEGEVSGGRRGDGRLAATRTKRSLRNG